MKDQRDFPAFTGCQIEDNIVHIQMKKVKKLTGEDVAQVYDCFKECGGAEGVFVLITFKGYIPMSDEAMAEAKRNPFQKNVHANAYVIQTAAFRVAIKFFMTFYKPKQPIYICDSKAEGIAWLKQKKKERELQFAEL